MTHIRFWFHSSRAQAYLIWLLLLPIGFIATHFYQNQNINVVWIVISIIGLGVMFKVMPMQVRQMQLIFLSWLVPITIGIVISVLSRYAPFDVVLPYLGAFWLVVMAVGFFFNGLVDEPVFWYFLASALCIVAAVVCYLVPAFTSMQYLVAAAVSGFTMASLWIFRSA